MLNRSAPANPGISTPRSAGPLGDRLVDPSLARSLAPQQPGKAPATQTQNPTSQARAPQVGAPKMVPPQAQASAAQSQSRPQPQSQSQSQAQSKSPDRSAANQDGVVDEAALAEAKKMLWDKSHPFHGALHDAGHFQHGYAVERYAGLFRKAYGEEAGEGAGAGANAAAGRDAAAGQPHAKPVEATRVSTKQRETDGARGDDEAIHGDHGDDASVAPGRTQLAQTEDEAQDEDTRSDDELRAEDPQALFARDRARGEAQAAQRRREEADRVRQEADRDHMIGTRPPSWVPPQTDLVDNTEYREILDAVAGREDLSDAEKHIYARILTYETLRHDEGGNSVGGILQKTLDRYRDVVNSMRQSRTTSSAADDLPQNVVDLKAGDVIDIMKVYFTDAMTPGGILREVKNGRDINYMLKDGTLALLQRPNEGYTRIAPLPLLAEIFDVAYQMKTLSRGSIVQGAVNAVLPKEIRLLLSQERQARKIDWLTPDGRFGSRTLGAIRWLVANGRADLLLQEMRQRRALLLNENDGYRGASQMRVWGLIERPN